MREAAKLTQQRVAERADLAISQVQAIEQGRANPTTTTLAAMAKALGVGIADLFTDG